MLRRVERDREGLRARRVLGCGVSKATKRDIGVGDFRAARSPQGSVRGRELGGEGEQEVVGEIDAQTCAQTT